MKPLIFMIPHPDDEILACTYWIQYALMNRVPYQFVFFTDGENDLLGELLTAAETDLHPVGAFRIGISTKLAMQQRELRSVSVVLVQNAANCPVHGASVVFSAGSLTRKVQTNEIGWACIVTHVPLTTVSVEGIVMPSSSITPVSRAFHARYGEIRFQESLGVLLSMGIVEERILRLRLRDGAVGSDEDIAQQRVRSLIQENPGCILISPHERDWDFDHRVIARLVEREADGKTDIYRFLVHQNLDHKNWPPPSYVSTKADRLQSREFTPPLKDEPWLSFHLSEVGFSWEKKLELIRQYKTQNRADEYGFLLGFAKENEIYYL